jgi:hypothetical protein
MDIVCPVCVLDVPGCVLDVPGCPVNHGPGYKMIRGLIISLIMWVILAFAVFAAVSGK